MLKEQCPLCGGEYKKEIITHEEWWGDKLYVFKNVPALVCENCGEVYFSDKVLRTMDKIIRENEQPEEKIEAPVFQLDKFLDLKAAS